MRNSVTFEEIIPEVKKRLAVDGENAPFGDQYIADNPTYGMIGWPHQPDTMSQLLSAYGERCSLEKTFALEDMTKQFHAEVSIIQDVLVEKLGSDIHRRRGSALLAWQNIALPIREVGKNIICIFPPDDLYGHPVYDVMPCDRFIRWVSSRATEDALARRKSEKIIKGLIVVLLILVIVVLGGALD